MSGTKSQGLSSWGPAPGQQDSQARSVPVTPMNGEPLHSRVESSSPLSPQSEFTVPGTQNHSTPSQAEQRNDAKFTHLPTMICTSNPVLGTERLGLSICIFR